MHILILNHTVSNKTTPRRLQAAGVRTIVIMKHALPRFCISPSREREQPISSRKLNFEFREQCILNTRLQREVDGYYIEIKCGIIVITSLNVKIC